MIRDKNLDERNYKYSVKYVISVIYEKYFSKKNAGIKEIRTHHLGDTGVVFYKLSNQANRELESLRLRHISLDKKTSEFMTFPLLQCMIFQPVFLYSCIPVFSGQSLEGQNHWFQYNLLDSIKVDLFKKVSFYFYSQKLPTANQTSPFLLSVVTLLQESGF